MATPLPKSMAALRAMDNTKAVFPIPGRAANTIMSLGCQPLVTLSRSEKPVGTPVSPPDSPDSWP